MIQWNRCLLFALVISAALGAFGLCEAQAQGGQTSDLRISSTAFQNGGTIPRPYTCDGNDASPPLAWTGVPAEAKSLALIVDDPDAPVGTWIHWVVFNIPADVVSMPEQVPQGPTLANGAQQGVNSWNRSGYGGPCPPRGQHRYFFKLYALDVSLNPRGSMSKAQLLGAMRGHVLAEAQIIGTYSR